MNSKIWLIESCLLFNDFRRPSPTVAYTPPFPVFLPLLSFPFSLLGMCSVLKGTKSKQMELWLLLRKSKPSAPKALLFVLKKDLNSPEKTAPTMFNHVPKTQLCVVLLTFLRHSYINPFSFQAALGKVLPAVWGRWLLCSALVRHLTPFPRSVSSAGFPVPDRHGSSKGPQGWWELVIQRKSERAGAVQPLGEKAQGVLSVWV